MTSSVFATDNNCLDPSELEYLPWATAVTEAYDIQTEKRMEQYPGYQAQLLRFINEERMRVDILVAKRLARDNVGMRLQLETELSGLGDEPKRITGEHVSSDASKQEHSKYTCKSLLTKAFLRSCKYIMLFVQDSFSLMKPAFSNSDVS